MLKDIQETFERFRSINMKLNLKKCSFDVKEGPFLGHLITKQDIKANPSKVKAVTDLDQPRTLKDVQSLNEKLAALSQFLSKGAERSLAFFKVIKGCKDKKSIQWTTEADKELEKTKKLIQALPTLTLPKVGETLTMHLAASRESISVVLAAKRNKGWTPIFFISRVLQGAKLNYLALEKLVLALVHAARRLRRYFQSYTITVLTNTPIKQMFIDTLQGQREEIKTKGGARFKHKTDINQRLFAKGKTALRGFEEYTVEHVYMNHNNKADALSKLASMTFKHLTKEVLVKVLTKRSIEEKEVLKVDMQERKSWRDPIHEYLQSELFPEDTKEARKIRIQTPEYKLI
nr:protein NYNRIN-like [Tanacetum cinerariifolium]